MRRLRWAHFAWIAAFLETLKPGFHCARTHWIRGFIAFQLARRTRIVMLMVPVAPVAPARFLRERYDAVTIG